MLVFTFGRTQPTIERSQQAEKLALLSQVLPPRLYDNDLLASRQSVPPDDLLGTRQPSSMWIARRGGVDHRRGAGSDRARMATAAISIW